MASSGNGPPPKKDPNAKEKLGPTASVSDLFRYFGNTSKVRYLRTAGIFFSLASGLIYPAMAFVFANVFTDLGADPTEPDYLENVRSMIYNFLYLGAGGFVTLSLQGFFLELAASESTVDLKNQWFEALLRQDMSYFDIKDVSAQATIVSVNATKYKKGTGRKLGEGIQFATTSIGGLVYAFYSSWRVSLLILALLPVMAFSGWFMMKVTTKKSDRENKNYLETGGIVYSTVSAIRTVFSLNACEPMIAKFEKATKKSFESAKSYTYLVGLAMGMLMASFLLSYLLLTLYGSYLLYSDVRKTGCDPSGILETFGYDVETCGTTSVDVFAALLGVSFGAMGLGQISAALEALNAARAAIHPALIAINRKVGQDVKPEDIETPAPATDESDDGSDSKKVKKNIPLPPYLIDSSSPSGKKPSSISGAISFNDVSFIYPTRPDTMVFDGFNLNVEAGKTIALVGPSGGGKSTTVAMIERFYDPSSGSVSIDGQDIRELNVEWLRNQIGLVSQEPTLFARSIRENILYGNTEATEEEVIRVAKLANAHDFISKFPLGYETEVGDKGAQLSGGQKQRIAIARILLKNPKILLLDEATSALDTESEYLVQKALDDVVGAGGRTTIIIAHRLSTIRNADMIAVVKGGKIVETGTHDELMSISGSEYSNLVEAQAPPVAKSANALSSAAASMRSSLAVTSSTEASGRTHIEFNDVRFAYPSRPGIEVFKGLNLEIKEGETLAIAGPSGGGKSTVIQMIERFYDPASGSVTLNGTDLKELNVSWLRDQIGLVSQEPTLFDTTIGENIKAGYPGASQADIEDAAKKANAHDFIMGFPQGYDTEVGENGTQISGGQKQRIAIARAIIKKPKILLLDEATSALDSESERVVQDAIDNLIATTSQTVVVIAHRLSTIQNANRIAVVADGVIAEIGSHDELMANPDGQYKRLNDFRLRESGNIKKKKKAEASEDDKEEEDELTVVSDNDEQKEKNKENANRAKKYAGEDKLYFAIGGLGAILSGLVYPGWGVAFGFMVDVIFKAVLPCDAATLVEYGSCEDYWDSEADSIRTGSFNVTYGWLSILFATVVGNVLLCYGFGVAQERMNKRVRDAVFKALMRQDMSYYDTHSLGNLATKIEEDAAMIHSFSGEPIRTFVMSTASVVVGLVIAFVYMWPVALMTLGILPFMGFGAHMEMKMYLGEDDGGDNTKENEIGPGAIVVETLLNIKTVASLTIQKMRAAEYKEALMRQNPTSIKENGLKGFYAGLGLFIQMWGMGLMFWWGAYCLNRWPNQFTSTRDFFISTFSLLFSLSGMSAAIMGATDQEKAKQAANRIFAIIDTEGDINALSKEGKRDA